jgi:type I restriction enzyme S subunit
MAGEWRNGRLGDYILLQSGGTPSKSRPDYWSGDLPWVSAKDMKSYWIDDTEDRLSEAGANAATRVVEGGTTLLLVRGMTLHNDVPICRVRRRSAFNQDVKAVLPRPGTDPEFIAYLLLGNKTRLLSIVDSAGHGTGRINSDTLLDLPVNVPPLSEQQAIACLLGSLDDKIELNRRMNRTLEEMARATFKSWFIDFAPVRAKAAIRREHPKWTDEQVSRAACPKLNPKIARLFPDSFEDSELDEIPRGWRVKTIGDLAEIVGGSTPRTTEAAYWEGGTHAWATPKDLSKLSVPVLLETERRITDDGLAQISSGLLPVGTVLLSSRAPIGYLAIAEVPVAINQGFIAMKPRDGVSNLYLLFWARAAHEEIVSRANGSTFLEISKSSFRPIPIVAPPPEVFAAFERLAKPLFARLVSNEHEFRTLAALRDALLPKLISGELRVPDAERIAARCA